MDYRDIEKERSEKFYLSFGVLDKMA